MKIAVVGKGGSGKSTITTLLAYILGKHDHHCYVIDADYNCDVAYNLGWDDSLPTRNTSYAQFQKFLGYSGKFLPSGEDLFQLLDGKASFEPKDDFIAPLLQRINDNISLCVVGEIHQEIMYGNKCSHGFYKPLKYYLPHIHYNQDKDFILIDSVAGTDMIGYGLYLGVDAIIVVVEPTRASIHVYEQIKQLLSIYNIPLFVIYNKVHDKSLIPSSISPNNVLGHVDTSMKILENKLSEVDISHYDSMYYTIRTNIQKTDYYDRFHLYHQYSQK